MVETGEIPGRQLSQISRYVPCFKEHARVKLDNRIQSGLGIACNQV